MAELPILPLKTGALLADTNHLSTEEFGAYCRLLFTMWQHEARLPEDQDEFARIAGLTPNRWAKMAARVLRPMTIIGGLMSQKRLSSTWLNVQELRAKRAGAANTRWKSTRDANALHMQSESNATKTKTSKNLSFFVAPAPENESPQEQTNKTPSPEEPSEEAVRKAACAEATRQELERIFAARREKKGAIG